jgi:hypothetical protein
MYAQCEPELDKIEKRIQELLPALSRGAEGHNWISHVNIGVQMHQLGAPLSQNEKAVARIWKPGMFRLFIS